MADEFDANEFLSGIGVDPEEGSSDSSAIKTLRKTIKDLGKRLNEATATIATYETEKAQTVLKSTWDELKVPEAIRGFYTGDKTPEAIKSWWESSKGFFNIQDAPAGEGQQAPPGELTPEQREQQQVAQAAALGHDQPSLLSLDAFQKDAESVKSTSANKAPKALDEWLSKHGIRPGALTPPQVG